MRPSKFSPLSLTLLSLLPVSFGATLGSRNRLSWRQEQEQLPTDSIPVDQPAGDVVPVGEDVPAVVEDPLASPAEDVSVIVEESPVAPPAEEVVPADPEEAPLPPTEPAPVEVSVPELAEPSTPEEPQQVEEPMNQDFNIGIIPPPSENFEPISPDVSDRDAFLPARTAVADGLFPMSDCFGFKLEEATIDDMQRAMESGMITSENLVDCYILRNSQLSQYTNSLLQLNPDVRNIAATMDEERRMGRVRGPLHGIPFMVKDNIATMDKMDTTAGSWALLGSVVPRDAFVVSRLRNAGAVLFGKATMSEWADMRSTNYSEGYSARGGQARNPYNFTVNPGGSSTGSAIAVTVNGIAFSIGTETDGSITQPAERNAIVGIKPTVGLTSRAGVIPGSEHTDSIGSMGRTVRDATYVLDAIRGQDPRDPFTAAQQGRTPPNGYAPFLTDRTALKNATFGIPWESFWTKAPAAQQAQLVELIELIKSAGATIVNGTEIVNGDVLISPDGWNWDYGSVRGRPNESELTVIKVDFYNNINSYLSELTNTNIRTLEDIVAYNLQNPGSEGGVPNMHPGWVSGQDLFEAIVQTKGIKDEKYQQALGFIQSKAREGIDSALRRPDGTMLSGLLVPADVGQIWQVAAQAGYPTITIPAGIDGLSSMPYGLAIMQTAYAENELVKWASAIEDLQLASDTPFRRTLPTWEGYLQRNFPIPL